MKNLRVLGKTIEKMLNDRRMSINELGREIGCDEIQMRLIIAGRLMCPYSVIEKIANVLQTSIEEIVHGDEAYYKKTVVSCMTDFKKDENREMILDIVYDCLDVFDAAQGMNCTRTGQLSNNYE